MTVVEQSWELEISENQLLRLTSEMEEAHHESMPAMSEGVEALAEEARVADVGRRRFLARAGAAAAVASAAVVVGAGAKRASASTLPAPGAVAGSPYTGDLRVVALAVALENQAVGAYRLALESAREGKLGAVPPAVAAFVTTAMKQHTEHAKAWNAALTGAGRPAIQGVPLSNQPATLKALGRARSIHDVARLALFLEDQAAQTYLFATGNVSSPAGVRTAASIAPVEAMHAAILHFVLGQYPVPDAFLRTDRAARPALLTV